MIASDRGDTGKEAEAAEAAAAEDKDQLDLFQTSTGGNTDIAMLWEVTKGSLRGCGSAPVVPNPLGMLSASQLFQNDVRGSNPTHSSRSYCTNDPLHQLLVIVISSCY